MFFYARIISTVLITMIFISSLSAQDIEVRGKLLKVSSDGITEKFTNQKICIKDKAICTNSYSKGMFRFKKINKYLHFGEQIKLEISDKNWFMLSPFKGIYHVPNKSEKIEIIMIPKSSSIYLTLFAKVSHYTVQVFHGNDELKAIDMVKRLRHDCLSHYPTLLPERLKNPCWRKYRKKSNRARCLKRQKKIYCSTDNIYYQAILRNNRPHNGFSYKVNFGKYSKYEYQKARNDVLFIRKKYKLKKDIFVMTYSKTIEDR